MKKIMLLLFIIASICNAQETSNIIWEEKSSLPVGHHSGTLVNCSGSIYHIGGQKKYGNSSIKSKDAFKYDIISDTWTQIESMPTARMNLASAVVDGKIYVIGGDVFYDKNEMYDPATETWTTLAPMPTKRQHIKAVVLDSKIYIFGGLTSWNTVSAITEVYDTKTNTWETKKSMPIKKHNYSVAIVNGKIYLFGGSTSDQGNIWVQTSSVEVYDPEMDSWEAISTMPSVRFNPGIGVLDNKILIVGGYEGGSVCRRVDIFDPGNNSWSSGTKISKYTVAMGSTCHNNKIYIVGGSDGGPSWNCYTNVYEGSFENLTSVEKKNEKPEGYKLCQNFPNPFNPSTTIKFELPEVSHVKMILYNNIGEKVKEIINSEYTKGTHSVKFNFGELSSGTYYYKMIAADFQETNKMVLLK